MGHSKEALVSVDQPGVKGSRSGAASQIRRQGMTIPFAMLLAIAGSAMFSYANDTLDAAMKQLVGDHPHYRRLRNGARQARTTFSAGVRADFFVKVCLRLADGDWERLKDPAFGPDTGEPAGRGKNPKT